MSQPIDFYFDFSSPYGYFGSCLIDEIAARHGREVNWRPYLMGVALKLTGRQPLVNHDLLRDYSRIDIERIARKHDIAFTWPDKFPVATVAACRAYYWLAAQDPAAARRLASALYRGYFAEKKDISEPSVVVDIAAATGLDRAAAEAGIADPAVKEKLKTETDAAIARKVFGSPYFIVDGEPFWGADRLPDVDRWLQTGGW